jgi:hypothetical protein
MDDGLVAGGEVEYNIANAHLPTVERLHPQHIPVLDGRVHARPLGPKANSVPLVKERRTELAEFHEWTTYLP